MMKKSIALALMVSTGITALPAISSETEISGFLSTRYSQTDETAFYLEHREDGGINEDGSFFGTKLGINMTTKISEGLQMQSQLIAKTQGDSFVTHVDWAFLSQKLSHDLTLRSGKIKFPVGLVNEYVDVGVLYPWMQAPVAIYTDYVTGPQATRESYTGASLLWDKYRGDMSYGLDLFAGQVDLMDMTIKGMVGLTLRANWDDVISVQASTYTGKMRPDDIETAMTMGPLQDGKDHKASTLGVKYEQGNVIAYAEAAQIAMDAMNGGMDSDSWYATLGYRLGSWLPYVTTEDWSQQSGYGQSLVSLGLNYEVMPGTVIKLSYGEISSDRTAATGMFSSMGVTTVGLFSGDLTGGDTTQLISVGIDTIF